MDLSFSFYFFAYFLLWDSPLRKEGTTTWTSFCWLITADDVDLQSGKMYQIVDLWADFSSNDSMIWVPSFLPRRNKTERGGGGGGTNGTLLRNVNVMYRSLLDEGHLLWHRNTNLLMHKGIRPKIQSNPRIRSDSKIMKRRGARMDPLQANNVLSIHIHTCYLDRGWWSASSSVGGRFRSVDKRITRADGIIRTIIRGLIN